MIARFTILLPFDLLIREGDELPALDLNLNGYQIRFYAPAAFADRPAPTDSALSPQFSLMTTRPAHFTETLLVDGRRTARVNVQVMDFMKPDFDRSVGIMPRTDPPREFAFGIANSILARMRVYSRTFQIKPLEVDRDPWYIRYLTDDQQELEVEDGKVRGLHGGASVIGLAALMPETIEMIAARSQTDEPYAWDQLLLDSYAQLPDIGGAVVMASAALETFIEWALEILQKQEPLQDGLWDWINGRDHWTKEPSVSEKFDVLLRVFTKHSLKDEVPLWQSFVELRKARNSLAHEGIAKIGAAAVEAGKARELVNSADQIIRFVELLLPEKHRRVRTDATGPFTRRLATPAQAAVLSPTGINVEAQDQNRGAIRIRREVQATPATAGTDREPKGAPAPQKPQEGA